MNVIISNKNQLLLENLGVHIIKEMNGEFEADEIIATFQNFFYQRMILDITALKNYTDISNLQKLSISLPMEKLILLLDGTEATTNPGFLSNLVSMGIYNFTKNLEGIQYLYNTPNSYRDVAQFHRLDAGFNNANFSQATMSQQGPVPVVTEAPAQPEFYGTRVLGIKNITKQSGATSLIYMMKNELSKNYNVVAIEVDKNDFTYFKDKNMVSTVTNEVGMVINKHKDKNVILIDINNSIVAEGFCQDVVYLIEPSIIKLEKLMTLNAAALQGLKDKKIVLNQSLLSQGEVANFEYEARIKVFYNLLPLNERDKNLTELNKFLVKLGFSQQQKNL